MKVHFRTYCQGCRYGTRGRGPVDRSRCAWRRAGHRFDWEYYIEQDGRRLVQRTSFATFARAEASAQRAWFKLATVAPCLVGAPS